MGSRESRVRMQPRHRSVQHEILGIPALMCGDSGSSVGRYTLGHLPSRYERMPLPFPRPATSFSEAGQRLHFTGCDFQETISKTLVKACSRPATGWPSCPSGPRPKCLRLQNSQRVESPCFRRGQNCFAIASFVVPKARIRVGVQR